MTFRAFIAILSASLLIYPSCKNGGIDPPDDNKPDTTSHTFVWSIDTIPSYSGVLYDVAIIDENHIWAVGEIYIRDSTGQIDPLLYNVVKWDGTKWNLGRVKVNFRGNLITPLLEGVFAFSSTQIWLAGGLAVYGDGTNWTPHDVRLITGFDTLHLSKCWGTNPSRWPVWKVELVHEMIHEHQAKAIRGNASEEGRKLFQKMGKSFWAHGHDETFFTAASRIAEINGIDAQVLVNNL